MKTPKTSNWQKIYQVVAEIPEGKVATYGQIAHLAGLPGHARQVGYALAATPDELDLPWQRVINAKGEVSARAEPGYEGLQRAMLEAEGIVFSALGRVDLKRYQWSP
jgi:methylated-DNA-protein-cysteine methyltransferase-like protein